MKKPSPHFYFYALLCFHLLGPTLVLSRKTCRNDQRIARIDAAGALHDIICRGIERRKIFRDDDDQAVTKAVSRGELFAQSREISLEK
jgi:hypothetical protein